VVSWERGDRLIVLRLGACDGSSCDPPTVVAEVPTAPGPHNLVASGSVVWATHPRDGSLSRYDVGTGELMTRRVGTEPHDVAVTADGTTVYVTDEADGSLLVVDPVGLDVTSVISLPAPPHNVELVGSTPWVTLDGRDELAVLADEGNLELVPTGGRPHDLVAGGDSLWISQWRSPLLLLLDPVTGSVTERTTGLRDPQHFAPTPSGSVWVSDNDGGSVIELGEERNEVDVGTAQHHLGWAAGRLLAAGTDAVIVVDQDLTVSSIPVGRGLHGVATGRAPSLSKGP